MSATIVDSNVLLDILSNDFAWMEWSAERLEEVGESSALVINPVIYAEVSYRFSRKEDLEDALPKAILQREPIPYDAAFLAAKAHLLYRKRKGAKLSPLPDFFIGAHAAVRGYALLTRAPSRYRAYFPRVKLIAP